ncbi:tyrosine recombinase XerC [Oxobacter pfennigii]|uniref:Tyrosine recombinase XerC n=1 Tax=Oxobacter pfennigii TaxID=36849 RepID=A0A0P9AD23_9CLOT|nr:tyrosine-type recombinase/integrase [Oxobacter pfennigii]KPU43004.1 tyrosine recombinase XerC [Oxobacter pfennigii]
MARKTNYSKNGNEYYRVTTSIGRDSEGKLIRKEFYGKSKTEAEGLRDNYLNGIKNGLNIDFKDTSLGKLMHSWLFEVMRVSNEIKPTTFEKYEGIYRNYIKDSSIYGLKLDTLKSIQLQRYYNSLYENDSKSSNSINTLNKLLKTFFNYAIDEGYILKNPCAGKKIVIPGTTEMSEDNEETEVITFSDEEIKHFIVTLEGHRMKALYLLDFGTGLRQGELLGLKWSDIDFKKKELKVRQSLKKVTIIAADASRKHKIIEQTPKSPTSKRAVPIPSNILSTLEDHKRQQEKEKADAGSSYNETDYVFTTELGNPIDASNFLRSYARILKKANIPYRKFHAIRHTYATKLFERGVPLKTVQELLGHSDISITAKIYTHVMPEEKTRAVDKLNDLFA